MGQMLTVHLGEPGLTEAAKLLREGPDPDRIEGMRWAEVGAVVEFTPGPGPSVPYVSRVALVATWDGDEAVDHFLEVVPAARRFDWHLRMEPVRASGAWASLPGVPRRDEVLGPDDAVAVTTLAYTRPSQLPRFARTSMPAERAAGESPEASITIGIVRPPRFVATFSLWRTVAAMRAFAHPEGGGPHRDAIAENRRKSFHDEEAFIRARPCHEQGHWPHRRS